MNEKLAYELAEKIFYEFGELLKEYDIEGRFEDLIFYIEKRVLLGIIPNSDVKEGKLYIRAIAHITRSHKQILTEYFGEDFSSFYTEAFRQYVVAKRNYERTLGH